MSDEPTYDLIARRWSEPVAFHCRYLVVDTRHPGDRYRPVQMERTALSSGEVVADVEAEIEHAVGKRLARYMLVIPVDVRGGTG